MAELKIKKVTEEDEVGRIICKELTDETCKSYILVGEDETCLAEYYVSFAESIKNFEVRNSDVIVASYPKAGSTWSQEMIWLIVNNLDFKGAEARLITRVSFLEFCTLFDYTKIDQITGIKSPEFHYNSIEFTKKLPNPRFIKTHLPFSLLPDEIKSGSTSPKIIYVIRNPKDVCISYYHHGKLFQKCKADLENFCKVFLAEKVLYGSYWKHVLGFWEKRNLPNLLIINYEDMKKDLPSVVKKVANFLDKKLTDEQIEVLCKHLSFDSMKNNRAVNAADLLTIRKKHNLVLEDGEFIRSGTVGKYKEEMSAEMIKKFDAWIKQNIDGTSFGQQYDYTL